MLVVAIVDNNQTIVSKIWQGQLEAHQLTSVIMWSIDKKNPDLLVANKIRQFKKRFFVVAIDQVNSV